MDERRAHLLVICGPTATGKTDLAIALARHVGGEIVNADSRQVYRYMDIGTAKPTPAQRAAVPHHLLDVVDLDEEFSLALYQELALAAIAGITSRGRLPAVDPRAAAAIGPTNLRRIIRALEVYQVSGVPISLQQAKAAPPYRITTVWLDMPREHLFRRIDTRVDQMMAAVLLDELRDLRRRGYSWGLPALSSLGYKEFQPWFEGTADLETCVQTLKWNTHAFARRQNAWFKRLPHLYRVTAGPTAQPEIVQLLASRGLSPLP